MSNLNCYCLFDCYTIGIAIPILFDLYCTADSSPFKIKKMMPKVTTNQLLVYITPENVPPQDNIQKKIQGCSWLDVGVLKISKFKNINIIDWKSSIFGRKFIRLENRDFFLKIRWRLDILFHSVLFYLPEICGHFCRTTYTFLFVKNKV